MDFTNQLYARAVPQLVYKLIVGEISTGFFFVCVVGWPIKGSEGNGWRIETCGEGLKLDVKIIS